MYTVFTGLYYEMVKPYYVTYSLCSKERTELCEKTKIQQIQHIYSYLKL
jgi:hypothetical protein